MCVRMNIYTLPCFHNAWILPKVVESWIIGFFFCLLNISRRICEEDVKASKADVVLVIRYNYQSLNILQIHVCGDASYNDIYIYIECASILSL